MVSEVVDVIIDNNMAYVSCRFNLLNHGFSDTLEVGFPRGWSENELNDMRISVIYRDTNTSFDASVTEKKLDPALVDKAGVEIPFWTTFILTCKRENKNIAVMVDYSMVLLRKDKMLFSDLIFRYILKTGAFWEGTIGDAVIHVSIRNTRPEQLAAIKPEGYRRNKNFITWHFTDFEPDKDIEIQFIQDVVFERTQEAKRLLSINPADAQGHFLLGTVCYAQSASGVRSREALHHFEQAVAGNKKHWDARFFLAMTCLDLPLQRLEQLEAIVRNDPEYRCTDEALQIRPWGYPKTNSAREWLSSLKAGSR